MSTSVLGYAGRHVRTVGWVAACWGVVLLLWSAYNCFWQVGFTTFVQGIFYYGVSDGAAQAETNGLNYGVIYLGSAWLILNERYWARGVVIGVALVEGYNRLRSLTGALFDAPQREWFTGTTEGLLKLLTFVVGLSVTTVLVVLLTRSFLGESSQPTRARVDFAPQPAFQQPYGQGPAFGQAPQAGYGYPQPFAPTPPFAPAPPQSAWGGPQQQPVPHDGPAQAAPVPQQAAPQVAADPSPIAQPTEPTA
ncbi:hypothetical protein OHV05_21730 [Kitasatospora sp. NBC_00070]|uniref:hypothetical protein n=1 Tax=Kitasatospora sp. NBC_00070 TaxID=2975962 RepID=UPI0032468E4E